MIQMGNILEVADNSGARKIACIRMRGGSAGQYAGLGDIITASVKEAAPDSPFVEKHGKRVVRAATVRRRGGGEPPRKGRGLHRVRRKRRSPDRQRGGADRDARLRAGGPGAARKE